jgi:hypothetical protein
LFSFQDPEDFQRLRGVLDSIGYTDSGILEALGVKDFPSIQGTDVPLLLRRTNKGTPLDTLIHLFLIEVPCDVEAVQEAIRPMKLETWMEAGIVHVEGKLVAPAIKLLPYKNLVLAFDLPRMLQSSLREYYVMGIGRSTLTLANLTIRKHARRTLDLGTGCGLHAFLAVQHSDHVLAVDRNPRAVQIATFNAKLNGMSHVRCLEGDLFEPVQGQAFDLVVTNPPFVISPERRYVYRDGGMEADRLCQKIVRQVPQFLHEGGFCQILCNWAESNSQDWQERLHGWFEGTGCDVWVMRSDTSDAGTYASTWIQHTERHESDQYARRFEEWMAYYEEQGIDAVGAGLITMRRSSSHANWFRADHAPERMVGPCGDAILRGFELRDFLETVRDDEALLATPLRVSPDLRLERHSMPTDQGWADETMQLRLARGLVYTGNIDPYVANMAIGCNGQKPLRDLLADMAHALEKDPADIAPPFCNVVRGLVERGFLLPAGTPWVLK